MKASKWLEGPNPMPTHERIGYCVCFILDLSLRKLLE